MTTSKLSAYGSVVTISTTGLNSLANNTLTAGLTAYDNTGAALYPLCSLELHLAAQGSARANALVYVHMAHDAVGSSTQDVTVESQIIATFPFDAATTARTHTIHGIQLPPSAVITLAVYNATGQAFAASGNTLKLIPYTMTIA